MIRRRLALSAVLAVACGACAAPLMHSAQPMAPSAAQLAEFWKAPVDLAERNLFDGPWPTSVAPDPKGTYDFVSAKHVGVSPGFTVTDEHGTEWSVKQGPEAQVEVAVSRILSAVGYRQPPVYYLASWTLTGAPAKTLQSEGRFRPKLPNLKDAGEWSWHVNPFIGTQPYNGLRVLMMILNESDLKDSNNTIYSIKTPADAPNNTASRWYVVRDIGAGLGETGRVEPTRGDSELFVRTGFIKGVSNGEVVFNYHGRHQELADHLSPADVRWMCDLLARLRPAQWQDAFRAAGYGAEITDRYIARITEKIAEGQALTP